MPTAEEVFVASCEACALLWATGEYGHHPTALLTTVDKLQQDAERTGLLARIGQDKVQEHIARAFTFEVVRE